MPTPTERGIRVVISEANPQLRVLYGDLPSLEGVVVATAGNLRELVAALGKPTNLLVGDLGQTFPILELMRRKVVPPVHTVIISDEIEEAAEIRRKYPNVIAAFRKPIPDIGDLDDLLQRSLHGGRE